MSLDTCARTGRIRTSGAASHRILDSAVVLLCIAVLQKVGSDRSRRASVHLATGQRLLRTLRESKRNTPVPCEHTGTALLASDNILLRPLPLPILRSQQSNLSNLSKMNFEV